MIDFWLLGIIWDLRFIYCDLFVNSDNSKFQYWISKFQTISNSQFPNLSICFYFFDDWFLVIEYYLGFEICLLCFLSELWIV